MKNGKLYTAGLGLLLGAALTANAETPSPTERQIRDELNVANSTRVERVGRYHDFFADPRNDFKLSIAAGVLDGQLEPEGPRDDPRVAGRIYGGAANAMQVIAEQGDNNPRDKILTAEEIDAIHDRVMDEHYGIPHKDGTLPFVRKHMEGSADETMSSRADTHYKALKLLDASTTRDMDTEVRERLNNLIVQYNDAWQKIEEGRIANYGVIEREIRAGLDELLPGYHDSVVAEIASEVADTLKEAKERTQSRNGSDFYLKKAKEGTSATWGLDQHLDAARNGTSATWGLDQHLDAAREGTSATNGLDDYLDQAENGTGVRDGVKQTVEKADEGTGVRPGMNDAKKYKDVTPGNWEILQECRETLESNLNGLLGKLTEVLNEENARFNTAVTDAHGEYEAEAREFHDKFVSIVEMAYDKLSTEANALETELTGIVADIEASANPTPESTDLDVIAGRIAQHASYDEQVLRPLSQRLREAEDTFMKTVRDMSSAVHSIYSDGLSAVRSTYSDELSKTRGTMRANFNVVMDMIRENSEDFREMVQEYIRIAKS